ncbi:MAG: hypothetical protein ACF8CQ_19980 [Rhodopirellula sp. JB044]|uniref:hypothetical protein n=1 Tax=Rhodopirellula sp. JB044 TaxID=3342844 RepID=UPI00370B2796
MRFEQHRSAKTVDQKRNRVLAAAGKITVGARGGMRRARRRMLALSIRALSVASALAMIPGVTHAQGVTDVVLGSGSFQIPFNIASGGVQPREVHLYMATSARPSIGDEAARGDETVTDFNEPGEWRLLDRQPPGVGQFQVSQTPDGTFWFATRTIDSSGRPHPPGPIDPELKVVVDTTEPTVDLIAESDADGKVTASFSVEDATGISHVTVHYVTDTVQQWKSTDIKRVENGGHFQFAPQDLQWQQLSLRLRVLDRAGNETIVKKRVQKPRVAAAPSTRFASSPLGAGNPLHGTPPSYPAANSPAANYPAYPNASAPAYSHDAPSIYGHRPLVGKPTASHASAPRATAAQVAAAPMTAAAGNSPTLPPPSTADEISQDFGRSAPTIEMLPDASVFGGPQLSGGEPASDIPASAENVQAKTAAEAMRPLSSPSPTTAVAPSQTTAASPTPNVASQPGVASQPTTLSAPAATATSSGRASNGATADATPQTPFYTETIPAPAGQRPEPTQLNRPAVPESEEASDDNGPATSPWTPIDDNRRRNPSREFSTRPEPRPVSPGQLPLDSGRDGGSRQQRRVPVTSVDPLNLERLAQRAVVRHSDSNQFSLDYEIEAIGGRGVEEIELYGTTDGGQTWKKWGSDPDKISPFDIETNGEGIFGFQIVVVASNGLKSPSPLPGDAPDIVVVVDQTKPEVGITGAKYGEGDRAGSLVIAYHCDDRYLMSRPITLAFSDSPNGPWTTIAAGLRNIGDYVWPADPQLPRQIYLRIDATDQAGNVGGYVLEEPIDTRGLAPRARIRAFRSIPSR